MSDPSKRMTERIHLIRIAATINLEQEPNFSFLRDVKGHGAVSRELLRLALMGKKHELELEQIARLHYESHVNGLTRVQPVREAVVQNQEVGGSRNIPDFTPAQRSEAPAVDKPQEVVEPLPESATSQTSPSPNEVHTDAEGVDKNALKNFIA